MANASCWSWVTSTAVAPLALMISRTSSDRRSRRSTSRLENGSSSSSSSGRGASARASATRCCWPPEISCGYLSSAPERPTSSRQLAPRARCALAARERVQAEGDVPRNREMREQRVVLEHHADAALLRRHHRAGAGNDASAQADLALPDGFEPCYAAQHRGLAAAARAEQAADRAAREREAQAAHDFVPAVGVPQVFDLEQHARL